MASYRGDHVRLDLGAELHRALVAVAREAGASLFMVLQAGLAALLTRLGAGTDIPIGSPIAGRSDAALDDLIGFFVNTLVLRTDTSGNPSFRDLVGRVRANNLAAYGHQDVPFERLVEVVNPARSLARHPLFQVMLVLQNAGPVDLELAGLDAQLEAVATASAKFDLSVSVSEQRGADGAPGGIIGVVEYATDLFDRATVEALAARFVRLLGSAAAAPQRPIGSLDILGDDERTRILRDFNDTAQAVPSATVPALFAAQAARTPEATAVVFGDEHAQLCGARPPRQPAGASSARPRGRSRDGGGPVRRALGRHGGGAARHPQGGRRLPAARPGLSAERLDYMMLAARHRCAADAQLTGRNRTDSTRHHDASCSMRTDTAGQPDTAPSVELRPEHPVYVIFTSGSTGDPRACANTHYGLHNRLAWMQSAYGLTQDDVVLQKTPFGFDVSVWEFFWPLITGARLVLAAPGAHRDPARLAETIRTQGVTTLHFVPSMLEAFLAHERAQRCTGIRLLICSGEAL